MLSVGVLAFFVGTFAADREVPYVRHSGYVIPADPRPGDRISIRWHADILRRCPGKITRRWRDGDGDEFDLPSSPARYAEREVQSLATVVVPPAATCGPNNEYIAEAEYWCNWTHRVIWPLKSSKSIKVNVVCDVAANPSVRAPQ